MLLSGFNLNIGTGQGAGYDIVYGTISNTGAQFNLTGSPTNILELHFRWVATVGEHLQLFPITQTLGAIVNGEVVRVPFDYNNKVVWSAGSFEVVVTSILSSFSMVPSTWTHKVDTMLAAWSLTFEAYKAHPAILILDVNSLYGLQCPFADDGGTDKVVLTTWGTPGSVIKSFLAFHKVQQPGTNALVITGFESVRGSSHNMIMGDYSDNIANSSYNVNGVDPTAVRVYGL